MDNISLDIQYSVSRLFGQDPSAAIAEISSQQELHPAQAFALRVLSEQGIKEATEVAARFNCLHTKQESSQA